MRVCQRGRALGTRIIATGATQDERIAEAVGVLAAEGSAGDVGENLACNARYPERRA